MRRSEPHIGMSTPWGRADSVTKLADGLYAVGTPSHGGLKLSASLNKKMPSRIRAAGGWYEEDIQYNWVLVTFPELVEQGVVRGTLEDSHKTLRNWCPDEYEAVFGVSLSPAESAERQKQVFQREHGDDWVTIAAYGDWHEKVPEGMVGLCCKQAKYGRSGPERYFLVPTADYHDERLRTPLGFVCDPSPSPNAPYQEIGKL
jgi:hypothetical protein